MVELILGPWSLRKPYGNLTQKVYKQIASYDCCLFTTVFCWHGGMMLNCLQVLDMQLQDIVQQVRGCSDANLTHSICACMLTPSLRIPYAIQSSVSLPGCQYQVLS